MSIPNYNPDYSEKNREEFERLELQSDRMKIHSKDTWNAKRCKKSSED